MKSDFTFTSSRYGKAITRGSHIMTTSEVFALLQWQEREIERLRSIIHENESLPDKD